MTVINSVNTNSGALIALQTLNKTNQELAQVQKRVSTGYQVADASDNGAAFAVAQGIRSNVAAIGAVNQQLSGGMGVLGVALEGATAISNTLIKVRETLTKLADGNLSTAQRSQYNADLNRLRGEVFNFRNNAVFNSVTLIGSGATNRQVVSNAYGEQYTIKARAIQTSSIGAALGASGTAVGRASAAGLLSANGSLTKFQNSVLTGLNELGGDLRRVKNQINFNEAMKKASEEALGYTVDADLAKDSARLQALQIKQQLGAQALGVANQAPQVLLGLFR